MNIQMEGMHRQDCRKGMWSSCAFSGYTIFPEPPRVHHAESSPNPMLWGFLWRLHHVGMMNY